MSTIQTSTALNLAQIPIYGDISGDLSSAAVVNISNVASGTLSIKNGGTGKTAFAPGSIVYINSEGKLDNLILFEGQSVVLRSGSVTGEDLTQFKPQIAIPTNSILKLDTFESGSDIIFGIDIKQQDVGTILLAGADGYPQFSLLTNTNIPTDLSLKIITDSFFRGNADLTGSFAGQFTGDGSKLTNLATSQVADLQPYVSQIVNNNIQTISSLTLESIVSKTVNFANGIYQGVFVGDGSSIKNIDISSVVGIDAYINAILNTYSPTISISQVVEKENYLNSFITNYLSNSLKLYPSDISGLRDYISGIIAGTTVNFDITMSDVRDLNTYIDIKIANSVDSKISSYTSIAGIDAVITREAAAAAIKPTVDNIEGLNSYVYSILNAGNGINFQNGIFSLENPIIDGNLQLNFLNAVTVQGHFTGDGRNIYGITNDSLETPYITINDQRVYLGESVYAAGVASIIAGKNLVAENTNGEITLKLSEEINPYKANIVELSASTIQTSTVNSTYGLFTNYVSSSNFYGDGSGLQNITINNISNIDINSLTASSLQAYSASAVYIKSNVGSFESIIGDGSGITGIPYASIVGSPLAPDWLPVSGSYKQAIMWDGFKWVSHDGATRVTYYNCRDLVAGDPVCFDSTTSRIKKTNCSNLSLSRPIGIVEYITSVGINQTAVVQCSGENAINNMQNFDIGEPVFIGRAGNLIKKSDIIPGDYLSQIGIKSITGALFIQPMFFRKI